eukprot:365951-Chlamydomonas_euryale.AAC.9
MTCRPRFGGLPAVFKHPAGVNCSRPALRHHPRPHSLARARPHGPQLEAGGAHEALCRPRVGLLFPPAVRAGVRASGPRRGRACARHAGAARLRDGA